MARPLHVAHQFDADQHDWLVRALPAGSRVDRLPSDDPWRVPDGANVLLVANGMLRHMPRSRPGWTRGLDWVHLRPTGVDGAPGWLFDVPHLTVSRGASAVAIAEYVLAAMLDFEKRFDRLRVADPAGWTGRDAGTLAGRTLGLVGFGEIGRAVADRARAFGMDLCATTRSMGGAPPDVRLMPLHDLCAASDHLVLCAPLTPATQGMFDAITFGFCRPGQHLINVARGGLIVAEALRHALEDRLARATLDVWNTEPPPPGEWVYTHPRVVLTPHIASVGPATGARIQAILEQNLDAWVRGEPAALFGRVDPIARY